MIDPLTAYVLVGVVVGLTIFVLMIRDWIKSFCEVDGTVVMMAMAGAIMSGAVWPITGTAVVIYAVAAGVAKLINRLAGARR